jgi:hypothetical protein
MTEVQGADIISKLTDLHALGLGVAPWLMFSTLMLMICAGALVSIMVLRR